MILVFVYVALVVAIAGPPCSVWLRFPWGRAGACATVSAPDVHPDTGTMNEPHTGAHGFQANEQQESRR